MPPGPAGGGARASPSVVGKCVFGWAGGVGGGGGRAGGVPGRAAHLALNEAAIQAVIPRQMIRRPVLHDSSGLQHDDAVEIAHRRQPMRDGDHGAPAHQAAERFADRFLGFAVERRGGLVEQQDRRVLQERARNGDALALAARQLDAAVADHGRDAVRQRLDEVPAPRRAAAQHLLVRASGRP